MEQPDQFQAYQEAMPSFLGNLEMHLIQLRYGRGAGPFFVTVYEDESAWLREAPDDALIVLLYNLAEQYGFEVIALHPPNMYRAAYALRLRRKPG